MYVRSRREQRQAQPHGGQAHPGRVRGAAGAAGRARGLGQRRRGARAHAGAGARRQAVAAGGPHRAHALAGRRVLLLRAPAHAQVQGQEVVPAVSAPWGRWLRSRTSLGGVTLETFRGNQNRERADNCISPHHVPSPPLIPNAAEILNSKTN